MDEKYVFFDIPIYRLTDSEIDSENEKIIDELKEFAKGNKVFGEDVYNRVFNDLVSIELYPFKYNEIIGYLELYCIGSQIRIDYWYACHPHSRNIKKVFRRGLPKKQFNWFGEVDQINIRNNLSNEEILNLILKRIKMLKRKPLFKRRFFYTNYLEKIGKHINWKSVLNDKELNVFRK
ncbi:hypothetical protein ACOSP6_10900 [Tenacibaculum sp. MEBiC06402]|uniref:hypothetical protein n=1 Tax=unclassified Tenacibaculum TaxID=2635139 RepID=UPI003B9BFEEB